ncbi:MAG: ExeM/NucH family extracellular endonuclease [Betaproteobacteria bacterium]
MPGFPTTGSPNSFFLADLDSGVAGLDTLYVADDTAGLQKYALVAGVWTLKGTVGVAADTYRGLTGIISGSGPTTTVTLYATRKGGSGATGGGELVSLADSAGYNVTFNSTSPTLLATAGSNTAFRGVALAPASIATPADLTISVAAPSSSPIGNFNYTLTINNTGGTNATNVTATFALPSGVTYVGNGAAGGFTGSHSSGVVTFAGGAITAGQSVNLTVTVNAASATTINLNSGAALVDTTSAVTESNETNNASTQTLTTNIGATNTAPTIGTIPALSGVISDPTNPSVVFVVSDAESSAGSLTVTALSSSNTTVVPLANISLSNVSGSVTASITPATVGYSNITIQVSDGSLTATQVLNYAASAASGTPSTSRYHYGASDASTAIALDASYMLVADDENQALRLYNRQNSGYALNSFDYTSALSLTDIGGSGPREVDIEAATKVGSRIYWIGSHSNSSEGASRPNRSRLFATDISGAGVAATLSFIGYYGGLKTDLLAWDTNNTHGLGANYFGFGASTTVGVIPEAPDGSGFNIEGLVMAPDNTTAYIAFRAPLSPAVGRTKALLVPVTNFVALVGASPAAGPATFGAPIQLDLGGRGIREIQKNASNQYVIIAGPVAGAIGTPPNNFALYTWDGVATSAPLLRAANLTALNSGGSFESIVEVPTTLTSTTQLQLVSDNGDTVYYNDTIAAKDLGQSRFKKARSDLVALGNVSGTLPINAVQGTGATSPYVGQTVTVSGIVTANFEGPNKLGGFYIQVPDAEQDSNPATSEAIFIYTNNQTATPTVNVGDRVNVTGTVAEFGTASNTLTQISGSPIVAVTSTANTLPSLVTVSLPVANTTDLERYEGMRVQFTQTLTVTDNYSLAQYGELTLSSDGRVFTPTNFVDPNDSLPSGTTSTGTSNVAAVTTQASLNARRSIVLDDASTVSYPATIPYWDSVNNTMRIGSTVSNATGIMGVGFGAYRLYPTVAPNFTFAARPTTPPAVGGNVKLGSMNVLNYFNGNGSGGGFPTSRGADSSAEFARQRAKLIAAITGLNADVLGIMEMENDGTGASSAIRDLVNGLNAATAPNTWAFIADPTNAGTWGPAGATAGPAPAPVYGSTDEIKVTIIYKPGAVTPVGAPQTIRNIAFQSARAPVAQTFKLNSNDEQFTMVVNHFKSKGSSAGLSGDADQGDGQGLSNQTRRVQATALLDFINTLTSTGPAKLITVGDYNAYGEEDPLDILRAGGLTSVISSSYSFLFDGNLGALDHAFVTPAMLSVVTGADDWHINSEEPLALDYNVERKANPNCTSSCTSPDYYTATPYRASDHDPLLVGLNLRAAQAAFTVTAADTTLTIGGTTNLSSSGGSGVGGVTYASNNANCSISGTTLTAAAVGTCTITATKAADSKYNQAVSAGLLITVSAAIPAPQPPSAPSAGNCVMKLGVISCNFASGGAGSGSGGTTTAPITGYQMSCTDSTGATIATQNTTSSTFALPALPTGRAYTCQVVATSAAGPSAPLTARFAAQVIPLAISSQFDFTGAGFANVLLRGTVSQTTASDEPTPKAATTALQVGRWDGQKIVFSTVDDVGGDWTLLGVGDVTGSGKSALISRNALENVRIDQTLPPVAGTIVRNAKLDWVVDAVGDLDGDGKADILWRYTKPGTNDSGVTFAWFMGGGESMVDGVQTKVDPNVNEVKHRGGAPLNWSIAGIIDLNADSLGDIVWISPTNQVRALMGQAGRTWVNTLVGQMPAGYTILKLGDMDGDGKGDIVMRDTNGNIKVWLMNGTQIKATYDMIATDKTWQLYAAGDFDGNGAMDFVWMKPDRKLVVWLTNPTNITFPYVYLDAGAAPDGLVPVEP